MSLSSSNIRNSLPTFARSKDLHEGHEPAGDESLWLKQQTRRYDKEKQKAKENESVKANQHMKSSALKIIVLVCLQLPLLVIDSAPGNPMVRRWAKRSAFQSWRVCSYVHCSSHQIVRPSCQSGPTTTRSSLRRGIKHTSLQWDSRAGWLGLIT